jgi:hypothetical protein
MKAYLTHPQTGWDGGTYILFSNHYKAYSKAKTRGIAGFASLTKAYLDMPRGSSPGAFMAEQRDLFACPPFQEGSGHQDIKSSITYDRG